MTDETTPPVVEQVAEEVVVADADAPATPVVQAAPSESDKVQKRIDELTRKNAELAWRLAEKERKDAEPPSTPAKPIVAPTLAEFEYDDAKFQVAQQEYLDSLIDQRIAERSAKAERENQVKTREQTFQERQKSFAEKSPEYLEKVIQGAERGEWACSQVMAEMIQESDQGPAVALYLAMHPEMSAQIAQLPERMAARELGRIEASLEKPTPQASAHAPVSKAPPPVPKIEASDSTTSVKPTDPESDRLSDREWKAAREKQLARQRRA